jgi:hypothetical protein
MELVIIYLVEDSGVVAARSSRAFRCALLFSLHNALRSLSNMSGMFSPGVLYAR